ncbi:cupin domain-containing protein [Desulfobacula sp.]|uniref:cupin domain-containing protein n=1 Tax=Desulfobacula sp. TaxID=2593537 RepID=UPI002603730A|nr:cupin domain-containing protein [Desulfobacula sp.]
MKIKNIVLVLQLTLLLFVTTSLANANVQVSVLTKATESWDKTTLPQYPRGQPQVTILRILIPSGSILPLHTHPVINAGVLIKGELTVVTKNGKTLHLKAGDPIVEVVNTWHYGKNEGTEPADIIVFYAGTKDAPITVKE